MIDYALRAADELSRTGVSPEVIHIHTVKPIDEALLSASAKKTGCVVTVEEHSVIGGLGSAVCETLALSSPVPVARIGVQDKFGRSGSPEVLIQVYHMDVPDIVEAARTVMQKKGKKS
jgi:transketolase